MRDGFKALALAVALVATACGDGGGEAPGGPAGPVTVELVTWNVLHGGRFDRVTSAAPADIPRAIDEVWAEMEASDPAGRMRAVAAGIAAARPDLVGLQEAALWRSEPRDGSAAVAYDLAQLVLDELRILGAPYALAVVAAASDATLPGARAAYRFTDRDVILAREGLAVSNPRSGRFDAGLQLPLPIPGGGSSRIPRAWTSVDVELDGGRFRFVSTHLETVEAVSTAQAAELVDVAGSDLPVVLVGDFNSAPGDPAYELLVSGPVGLRDAWEAGAGPGLTCCREQVDDPAAALTQRVDLILHRGFTARTIALLGAEAASFQAGHWPSDHAGVAATLELGP
ncbi:endonuclease/exonuclease/phosphatase family protein [Anaeromyxobacter sp. Fw109-5]|uniref:endonuclease/exonuclease/phosphatase family protein n=1 Tax=Anaeromyxobacter sp. (strain Fw109-5) TaxID=404589 RepID=UPI0000ED6FD7|nr:endonuclease/exonuclease/phosphatase family protein [Anaeromyxobacter sp. Fw109-5]ABS27684.1 Endonuclease/exonuclease/phosphatase [Anaeromyxobacter sp. Fw109-5]